MQVRPFPVRPPSWDRKEKSGQENKCHPLVFPANLQVTGVGQQSVLPADPFGEGSLTLYISCANPPNVTAFELKVCACCPDQMLVPSTDFKISN